MTSTSSKAWWNGLRLEKEEDDVSFDTEHDDFLAATKCRTMGVPSIGPLLPLADACTPHLLSLPDMVLSSGFRDKEVPSLSESI